MSYVKRAYFNLLEEQEEGQEQLIPEDLTDEPTESLTVTEADKDFVRNHDLEAYV